MEIPPAVDSHGLFGVEELNYSRRESTGPREIGNLTPLQLFEFIQFAMKLDTALSLILVVKNLNLPSHKSTQRLPLGVFC